MTAASRKHGNQLETGKIVVEIWGLEGSGML